MELQHLQLCLHSYECLSHRDNHSKLLLFMNFGLQDECRERKAPQKFFLQGRRNPDLGSLQSIIKYRIWEKMISFWKIIGINSSTAKLLFGNHITLFLFLFLSCSSIRCSVWARSFTLCSCILSHTSICESISSYFLSLDSIAFSKNSAILFIAS